MWADRFVEVWVGGALVAGVATVYPLVTGATLGVSGLYDKLMKRVRFGGAPAAADELEAALLQETLAQFGPAAAEASAEPSPGPSQAAATLCDEGARLWFLPGVLVGGAVVALVRGGGAALTLGQAFTARFGGGLAPAVAGLFFAGVLLGFGARMGGGCTSGHGITGVALGERGSLVGTAVFWSTAVATAFLLGWLR